MPGWNRRISPQIYGPKIDNQNSASAGSRFSSQTPSCLSFHNPLAQQARWRHWFLQVTDDSLVESHAERTPHSVRRSIARSSAAYEVTSLASNMKMGVAEYLLATRLRMESARPTQRARSHWIEITTSRVRRLPPTRTRRYFRRFVFHDNTWRQRTGTGCSVYAAFRARDCWGDYGDALLELRSLAGARNR